MLLLPYTRKSAGYEKGTKCMGLSHESASIHLYISGLLEDTKCMGLSHAFASIHLYISWLWDRHLKRLEPCISFHTRVHQRATRQTPNAWALAMLLLPCTCTSAGYETDIKCMGLSYASASIHLYISRLLYRHQIHGFKPCIFNHTPVHQPAIRKIPNTLA